MEILQELLDVYATQSWAPRALISSMLVGVMCGILGCFIVLRNMALIGDALSHAILPGVALGYFIMINLGAIAAFLGIHISSDLAENDAITSLLIFLGAVGAGLLSAYAITWLQQHIKTKNDSAMGIVFTAMFSIGVIGISRLSTQGKYHIDTQDFLFGSVIGVSNEDLFLTAIICPYIILSVIVFYRQLFATTFQPVIAETMGISVKTIHYFLMLLLSFTVVASMRMVGVILVVAMLITPAATALLLSNRLQRVIFLSALIGLFSTIIGLNISLLEAVNTPPGPTMALVATTFYILAALFAPKRGILARWQQKIRIKQKIQREDIMKCLLKAKGKASITYLSEKLDIKEYELKKRLRTLRKKDLIDDSEKATYSLTEKGKKEANRLVRAHRLWETYLVEKTGLSDDQIHEDAEKLEHLLSEELLDEVDQDLGYPIIDPHGSPIPSKHKVPLHFLEALAEDAVATFTPYQNEDSISEYLWQKGILPNQKFTLLKKEKNYFTILYNGNSINIPRKITHKLGILPSS